MSKKASSLPPRPPAPKRSMGGGMSFSFKALEEEEEDDLTMIKSSKNASENLEKKPGEIERISLGSPTIVCAQSHITATDTVELESKQRKEKENEKTFLKKPQHFEKFMDFKDKVKDTINKKKDEFLSSDLGVSVMEKLASSSGIKLGAAADKEKYQNVQAKPAVASFKSGDNCIILQNTKASNTTNIEEVNEEVNMNICTDYCNVHQDEVFEDVKEDISGEYFDSSVSDSSSINQIVHQRKHVQNNKINIPVKLSAPNFKFIQKLGELPTATSAMNSTENNVKNAVKMDFVVQVHEARLPVKKLASGVIFLFLYLIIPLPSYINGMVVGATLSSLAWMLYLLIMEPPKPKMPFPEKPSLDTPPLIAAPEMKDAKGEDCSYKGWMNESMDYNIDTYSINQTHSVYVHLEGSMLRLRRPKVSVPKRAMWDEPTPNQEFIHQRHFDIEGSKILLLPGGLVKKRLWSKKYPICIMIAKDGKKSLVKQNSFGQSSGNGNQAPCKIIASNSSDSLLGFELVSESKCDSSVLYLFARTCQEKEQWFKRLSSASLGSPLKNHILEIRRILSNPSSYRRSSSSDSLKQKHQGSSDSLSSLHSNSSNMEETQSADIDLRNFVMYMSRLIPRDINSSSSPVHHGSINEKDNKVSDRSTAASGTGQIGIFCDPALLPLNALLGRCFWSFLSDQKWANKFKDRLQKKLSKIHIPYFIEELKVSEINLGTEIPVIRHANKPYLDENGFWVDLEVTYSGRFKMTIETKVNLLRLKHNVASRIKVEKRNKSAITNSDDEDSGESSTDEEEESSAIDENGNGASGGGTGKKILKYINKIVASKYFQSATENKYIKKAMTEVSNTPLVLTVEMQKLSGTLAVNIPPPPTDRLWYGFHGNPSLWLVAKPKVGEREVTVSHITEWIEKKLALEFQHVLVMPNMDDIVIPIMSAGSMVDICTALSGSLEDI